MKLIAEQIQDVEYITEAKEDGGKEMKIRGIFMQADMNLLLKVVRLGNWVIQKALLSI